MDFIRTLPPKCVGVNRIRRPKRNDRRCEFPDLSTQIVVLTEQLAMNELSGLYKAADAFVLPTRGEGWGRPIMEAMAMGLLTIATNWSGPTDFMTSNNSYPIPVLFVLLR
jgi:glycosyltransferase involved in cell wall biosynthesis